MLLTIEHGSQNWMQTHSNRRGWPPSGVPMPLSIVVPAHRIASAPPIKSGRNHPSPAGTLHPLGAAAGGLRMSPVVGTGRHSASALSRCCAVFPFQGLPPCWKGDVSGPLPWWRRRVPSSESPGAWLTFLQRAKASSGMAGPCTTRVRPGALLAANVVCFLEGETPSVPYPDCLGKNLAGPYRGPLGNKARRTERHLSSGVFGESCH